MADLKPGIGKGVLDPKRGKGKFHPQRFFPSAELADAIKHLWQVTWSLSDGETFTQTNIPYPAVHVVFEEDRTEVVGPITGQFTRKIVGTGRVVGAHLKPGMWSAFSNVAVAELVDQRPPICDVLPISRAEAKTLERELLSMSAAQSAEHFDNTLCRWQRTDPPRAACEARDLVARVEEDRTIKRAEQLAQLADVSLRSLQRMFKNQVGLSPKFVIQRFRILEASERLVAEPRSGAEIAAELGFSDQAHFIRAFKSLVGVSPEKYAKRNQD